MQDTCPRTLMVSYRVVCPVYLFIRPHYTQSMRMWLVVVDLESSQCRFVSLVFVSPTKMEEWIKPFEGVDSIGPKEPCVRCWRGSP